MTPYVSTFAAVAFASGAGAFWLKRVEATSGVWFRYADWTKMRPLSYIRQPGVTAEAATAALARVSSARSVPPARQLFFLLVVISLLLVPVSAGAILYVWLPGQWLPGL